MKHIDNSNNKNRDFDKVIFFGYSKSAIIELLGAFIGTILTLYVLSWIAKFIH